MTMHFSAGFLKKLLILLNYQLDNIFTSLGEPNIKELDQFPKYVKKLWGCLSVTSLRPQSPSLHEMERAQVSDMINKFLEWYQSEFGDTKNLQTYLTGLKKNITGREIAPNTGANATKFFTLATKSWKLVAKLATRMFHHNLT